MGPTDAVIVSVVKAVRARIKLADDFHKLLNKKLSAFQCNVI